MIKIVVGAGLSSGLTGFVDAWKRAENGDNTEERVLSFETREALERYFSESRTADEAEAYRAWRLAEADAGKGSDLDGRRNAPSREKSDEAFSIEAAVVLGRESAATGQSKSHDEISAWLRSWGRESPPSADE